MNPVDALFVRLRREKRQAFIPFVTAGDPDLETTDRLVRELAKRRAHIIEIGFPYSDPIADGAAIQASYTRALEGGIRVDQIFDTAHTVAHSSEFDIPLLAMVSYALVLRRGPERFLDQAERSGFAGMIVPDLPIDEAQVLADSARQRDLKLVQLVTPTTPRDRARRIAQATTGFLYVVSVTGITGERDRLPPELAEQIAWLRTQTDVPLCVGFGVSTPDHVRALRGLVDGVIVGSALVRRLAQIPQRPSSEVIAEIGTLAESLAAALREP